MEKYQVTIVLEITAKDEDQAKSFADEFLKLGWNDGNGSSGWDWGNSESDFRQVKRFRDDPHTHTGHEEVRKQISPSIVQNQGYQGCCSEVKLFKGPSERIITSSLHFGIYSKG